MIRRLAWTVLALAVAVGVALGLAALSPQQIVAVDSVELPRTTTLTCAVPGEVLIDSAGEVDMTPVGGTPSEVAAPARVDTETPVRVSAGRQLSAGVLVTGDDRGYAPCGPALTAGVVLIDDPAGTELVLVNSDAGEAAVDLTLLGPDGEITAVGARGILIAPGVVRRIALSVLAPEGPVAVQFRAGQGRVAMLATSVEGRPLDLAGPTTLDTEHLLATPTGASSTALLLTNPGEERLDVTLEGLGPAGPYVPAVTDSLSVAPMTTVRVALTEALAGEATTVRVTAPEEVGAALATTAGGQRATVVGSETSVALSGLVPGAGELLISNPDAMGAAAATVVLTPLEGEEVRSQVTVPAGSTVAVPLPEAASVQVRVDADLPVTASATSADGSGTVVAGLTPRQDGEPDGLPTVVRPELA